MTLYSVSIVKHCTVQVEAENAEAAKREAWEHVTFADVDLTGDSVDAEIYLVEEVELDDREDAA